jgi:hypothetical protein
MSRGLDTERDDDRGRNERPARNAVPPPDSHERRDPRPAPRPFEPRDPDLRSVTVPRHHFALPARPGRNAIGDRHRVFRLRDTESVALVTVGTFRVVFERDLVGGPYRGDAARLAQDVRHLRGQGLMDRRSLAVDEEGHSTGVLALTDTGRRLLEAQREDRDPESGQAVYSGWRKPAELIHDASLYRMYQVEAAAIEAAGGRIERVVLDDELKREVYGMANRRPCATDDERTRALVEAARPCDVPIIEGHLEFPDVRIEYETPAGALARVDLELVTSDYHRGHIAGKQAAGFTLYSATGSTARGIHSLGGGRRGAPGHEHFISSLLSL